MLDLSTLPDDQLNMLVTQGQAAAEELATRAAKVIEQRLENDDTFMEEELTFSATTRCACGMGYAYPKGVGASTGYWRCSSLLMKMSCGPGGNHSPDLPFRLYEVKSETQTSANGASTRPVK